MLLELDELEGDGIEGMLLELDELDGEGIEGMLELDELWLEDSQASSNPLRPSNSRPLPSIGIASEPRALAPAGNLFCLCLAIIILSLWSGAHGSVLVTSGNTASLLTIPLPYARLQALNIA